MTKHGNVHEDATVKYFRGAAWDLHEDLLQVIRDGEPVA